MSPKEIMQQLLRVFDPKGKGVGSNYGRLKLANGDLSVHAALLYLETTLFSGMSSMFEMPEVDASATALEAIVERMGPDAHVTVLAGDPDLGDPAFVVELLCEASSWKAMRLGDTTLNGALAQAVEFVSTPYEGAAELNGLAPAPEPKRPVVKKRLKRNQSETPMLPENPPDSPANTTDASL